MRKGLALLLSVALTLTMFPMPVFAADTAELSGTDAAVEISGNNEIPVFSDLPENWSKAALQNAAANGLLQGYNRQIRPGDNLTRAQMAAVINRAFGASECASLNEFKDVPKSAWYYDDMAKAVQMGTFTGTGNGLLQPDKNITREDAFLALSRAFRVEASSSDVLTTFTDQNSVGSWAKDGVSAMVAAGYISGSAGKLNPKSNITRAEFAQLMDNLLKQYITKSGNYSEIPSGNIMINAPGATLKNVEIKGDLIIGDGVGDGEVTLDNVAVTGRMVVRGGGENSIVIKGDSIIRSITIVRVGGKVRVYAQDGAEIGEVIVDGKDDVIVEGSFDSILILADHVTVTALKAAVEKAQIDGDHSVLLVKETSSIDTATVKGDHSAIRGEGTVKKVFADGSNVTVETLNTAVTASKDADNVKAGEQEVKPGETIVTGTSKPSSSSSGGGGSNNNNEPDEPDEPNEDVAAPAVLPSAGEVTSGTAVTLNTATAGAKIYFTVDGSTPTMSSMEYTEPIVITQNITIQAIAVKTGMNNSSILTAAFTVAAAYEGPFAGGTGTEEDPYEVATAEQLDLVRDYLSANFVQIADIDLEDYVASGGDGYHEGKGWEPIGTYETPFSGNYDGDGYEINGLILDREENYVGLFGVTESSAVLKDISLTSVHVSGWGQTGGLIGRNLGEIRSCTVSGIILVKKDRNYGGLLAGMNNGTINGCTSSGSVDGAENNQELGGLVGENESNGKIQDSASSASVSGDSNLGGLTGNNAGTIINSDASGSVTASGDESGGLTGYNSGSIEDSFASGDVASGGFYTGGLTGTNWGEITGCFANGSAYSTKNVVGGLAGINYGTIRHSYTVALVNGPSRTGGLTGANSEGTIEFCYAASPITTGESNPVYTGGLVGLLNSGTVTASYYDAVTAGQSDTGKGVALNIVEMRDQNSFSGWDFADVWTMDSGSYPYLQWQNDAIPYPPSGFAGGSGTAADPYKVATAEQLDKVRDHLDKHFIQTANIDLTDYLASGGAGYNDGEGWEPIGAYDQYTSVSFTGSYDGDGYTITGLVINRPSSDYQGLFGCAVGAELTDIHFIAPLVKGDEVTGSLAAKSYSIITDCSASSVSIYCEDDSAGGLVGENYGTITNCSTTGTVKCDYANAGGLVGYNSKTGTDPDSYHAGLIQNCYSDAEVTYLNAGEQELEKAGGLVGYNSEGSIQHCHATGNVTGNEYAGGLIGNSWKGTVTDCYATGDVSGISDYDGGNSYDVGGLIGESSNENLVKDCWASGKVIGQNYTGGLVGDNGGACTIESCYVADTDSSVSGSNQVGGLVGYNSGTITKSYTKNTVSGGSYLGGLCGYCGSSGIVEYSYSDSTVTGTGGASLYTAGGLCGSVQYASVHDCYATGAVTSYREVGGLCGYLSVGASVQNCYSTGSVTGTVAVGGLVGTTTTSETLPTVTASFYDQDTSGLSDDSGKGTPLTTIQMITQNSFFGWDFTAGTGVWTMDSSPASYPYLQWQSDDIPYLPSNFDGGTGTAADPYEVATAEQLDKVRDHLNAYFIQTANIDLTDYLSAEGDGYNEGKGWEPIGNADGQSYRFTGSYDGNGKKISGLIIDRSAEDYIGMFGFTDSTSTLSDIYLIADDVNGRQIVGGLTGSNYGMVTGCRVFGSVTSSITGVDACVGGMIGYNYGGTVEYSYADCIVSSQSSHTGGLIGYNVDNDQSGKSSIVRQCFSAGEVSSPGTGPTGGLIGYNGAEINNCYSVASVNAKVNVGGLAGYNSADGTVSNCYAAGEVEGSSSPGGLIGKNNSGTVINSYYNSITTGQTDTGKGEPLTTTEMQEKANFSGWDFTDVWTMDTGTYPYLQWQGDENIPYPIPG